MTKTDAAAQTLSNINPDVQLESYTMNITTIAGFDDFKASICNKAGKSRVDMVLSCVDNYEARMTINQASPPPANTLCIECQPLLTAGLIIDQPAHFDAHICSIRQMYLCIHTQP